MHRRRLGVFTGLCAAAGVLVTLLPGAAPAPASATSARASAATSSLAPGEKPNIVLITADDMRADDLAFMPRTKKLLAQAGVTFTDALSNYPLCCPARATILTGQYSHNNGIKGNEWPYGGYRKFYELGDEKETLPVWLQRVGYRTGFIGKYLNGYSSTLPEEKTPGGATYVPPGWNDWRAVVGRIWRYYCPTLNQNGHLRRFPGEYQTDLYSRLSRRFINEGADSGKPFFLWASYIAPHLGFSPAKDDPCQVAPGQPVPPAKRHVGMFAGMPLPHLDSGAFNEADMEDKGTYMKFRDPLDLTHQEQVHEARLESLQSLDESVADTVAALRDKGVLDKTLLVFASDNGWLLGEHRAEKKILPYEESLTVPIVVRGPGFPAGVRRTQTVGLVDIPATALDVSGAVATKPQDGVSLVGAAQDPSVLSRRVMPIEAGPAPVTQGKYGYDNPDWYYRGTRTARYSYIAWQMANNAEEEEFYDLVDDPFQLDAKKVTSGAALEAMRQLTSSLKNCQGNVPDAPGSCIQSLPAGIDDDASGQVKTTDPTGPTISNVQYPKGWITSTRPTVRYTVGDATTPVDGLKSWCSDQAEGCHDTTALRAAVPRLHGEGRHNWTIHVTDPAGNVGSAFGSVYVDLLRPRVLAKGPAHAVAEGTSAGVAWRVTDSASGLESTDTRRRTATLAGGFTPWRYPAALQNQALPPRTTSLPTRNGTVCLEMRALDRVGHQTAWKAQLCRAQAIDADTVTSGNGWSTRQRDGWYAGTANVTTRRGAALSVPSRGGIGLVRVVARTGPGMGALRLTVGGTFVKRIDLDRAHKGLVGFLVPTPGLTGAVKATVSTSGEPVWVDSIGVVKRPGR